MSEEKTEYYVYVYIDPRNFEEFYYGKGKDNRKEEHLRENQSDSEKSKRIKSIKEEGLNPIIRVIAKELTESQAFLIEKTLIWKLGRTLTNKSSGHFADKFRPHNTFHKAIPYFDYDNDTFYVNVGEGKNRCWVDCRRYGFLAAGQGNKWSDQIKTLEIGDIVVAYVKKFGFVGVGRVRANAVRVGDYKYNGKLLHNLPLKDKSIFKNSDNEKCEYLVGVEWLHTVNKENAKWRRKTGLFTTQLIKASLRNQTRTIEFLEQEFNLKFQDLLK